MSEKPPTPEAKPVEISLENSKEAESNPSPAPVEPNSRSPPPNPASDPVETQSTSSPSDPSPAPAERSNPSPTPAEPQSTPKPNEEADTETAATSSDSPAPAAVPPAEEAVPPSPVVAEPSRRRIAFVLRERPVPAPIHKTDPIPPPPDPPASTAPPAAPEIPIPQRVRRPWSIMEVSAFFEGIKLYGKDFDSVIKLLARRKIVKSREHIKTFFFNSVKSYRALLSLTDEDFVNLPRDARELFLLINACEWKRKTLNMKIQVEKFRELLFHGIVTVRAGRRFVTIRTPPCPALCRYFSVKKANNVPNEVYVHLEPTSNGDHVFMRNRDQNPYLRVKLNTNDRIMKLLDFLHRKWAAAGDCTPITVTLWPDSSSEIASLVVNSVENSPFIALSMNKLIRNVEETRERQEPKKSASEGNQLKLGTEVNTKVKSTHNIVYPKPFVLNDRVIAEGLTFRNVRNAIIAELFCVCGRKNPIKLRYQVQSADPENRSTEPWRSLINLLDQGYGESLQPVKVAPVRQQSDLEPPSAKKKKQEEEKPPMEPVPEEPPGNPISEVVRKENDDFASQLAFLKKTSRRISVPANRKSTKSAIATRTPQLSIRPPVVDAPDEDTQENLSRQLFTAPKCTIVPKKQTAWDRFTHQIRMPVVKKTASVPASQPGPSQPSTSQQRSLPIDFSSVVFSPIKKTHVDLETQKRRTDDFLSSLRTPVDSPRQTSQKSQFQQLFGDELSMSPNSTRHASQIDADGNNTSVVDFTDLMYNQLRDQPNDTQHSHQDLDVSSSEVQQHLLGMMSTSQDSHDYIYEQFSAKRKATSNGK